MVSEMDKCILNLQYVLLGESGPPNQQHMLHAKRVLGKQDPMPWMPLESGRRIFGDFGPLLAQKERNLVRWSIDVAGKVQCWCVGVGL